jgi:hypothetical protein
MDALQLFHMGGGVSTTGFDFAKFPFYYFLGFKSGKHF